VAPRTIHHLDQNHSILALVSAGLGAALVPDSLRLIQLPNVVFRDIQLDQPEPIELFLLWRPDNANPVLETFLSLCRSVYSES